MPRISVIIPCYNHGQYIDEAINSVLAQTFQDFEIIVVNDGSTDEFTINILSNSIWPKTKVLHTENFGLSAARNNGIKASSGEIIVTLDSDDVFLPTFFEKGISILEENENIGVVSCFVEAFGHKPEFINYYKSGGLEHYIIENNSAASSMFRKKCWVDVGGYDESMKNGYEDWEFWISITSLGWKVHIIPEFLFKYRKHASSMLTKSNTMRPELVKYIFEKHQDALKEYFVDIVYTREQQMLKYICKSAWEKEYNISLSKAFKTSKSYKLGNFLITPFALLKKFFIKSIKGH